MRCVCNSAMTVVVWATTASVLLANTPHFECRCPDGTVKPICLGSATAASPSCCGSSPCCSGDKDNGSCCSHSRPEQPKTKKPCCNQKKNQDRRRLKTGKNDPVFESNCCQKTLAQSVNPPLSEPKTRPANTLSDDARTAVVSSIGIMIPTSAVQSDWQITFLPPPTDLVSTCQRLTI